MNPGVDTEDGLIDFTQNQKVNSFDAKASIIRYASFTNIQCVKETQKREQLEDQWCRKLFKYLVSPYTNPYKQCLVFGS